MSFYADDWLTVHLGDCRAVMAAMEPESVHCVVTSPPYWGLRDYGTEGQLGLEPTPEAYVEAMVAVFREVRRVLRSDGTVWLNLGDSYAASNVSGPHPRRRHDTRHRPRPLRRIGNHGDGRQPPVPSCGPHRPERRLPRPGHGPEPRAPAGAGRMTRILRWLLHRRRHVLDRDQPFTLPIDPRTDELLEEGR